MASMNALPWDPSSDLDAAEEARERLAGSLRLPSWFHTSLGAAVLVQVAAAASGVADQSTTGLLVAVAGCLVFAAVAAVQLERFRRLNHVRVDGLASRAVLGTSARSSLVYAAGLAGAIWAAMAEAWWLSGLVSLAAGAGYAASAWLWWRDYRQDPVAHAPAESRAARLLYLSMGVAGLVVLLALR